MLLPLLSESLSLNSDPPGDRKRRLFVPCSQVSQGYDEFVLKNKGKFPTG